MFNLSKVFKTKETHKYVMKEEDVTNVISIIDESCKKLPNITVGKCTDKSDTLWFVTFDPFEKKHKSVTPGLISKGYKLYVRSLNETFVSKD